MKLKCWINPLTGSVSRLSSSWRWRHAAPGWCLWWRRTTSRPSSSTSGAVLRTSRRRKAGGSTGSARAAWWSWPPLLRSDGDPAGVWLEGLLASLLIESQMICVVKPSNLFLLPLFLTLYSYVSRSVSRDVPVVTFQIKYYMITHASAVRSLSAITSSAAGGSLIGWNLL